MGLRQFSNLSQIEGHYTRFQTYFLNIWVFCSVKKMQSFADACWPTNMADNGERIGDLKRCMINHQLA